MLVKKCKEMYPAPLTPSYSMNSYSNWIEHKWQIRDLFELENDTTFLSNSINMLTLLIH